MLKNLLANNKLPFYYGAFILLALIPHVLGFNTSIFGDIWKIIVLLSLCFLIFRDHDWHFSHAGLCYMIFYLIINVICLVTDTDISISTITSFGISILLVYLFLECPIKERNVQDNEIMQFFRIFAIFMLVSCVYNMVVNFRQLLNLSSISVYSADATASFFDNKNTFGVFLIFGAISATFLKVINGNSWWLLALAVFIVNELMAMCRTAILITIAFLIVSFLVGDRKTIVKRIVALVFIIVGALALYFFVSSVRKFIDYNLFGDTESLDVREEYVDKMMPLVKDAYLFFGYGKEASGHLAYQYTGNRYYHNTYLHILMMGGLLKLLLILGTITYSIVNSIKLIKLNRKVGCMCIVTILVYLVYAAIESVIIFDTPVISMLATIFVVSIPQLFLNSAIKRVGESL